jgi:hypothetical protein
LDFHFFPSFGLFVFLFAPLYFYYLDISTIINYILFILLINYIYYILTIYILINYILFILAVDLAKRLDLRNVLLEGDALEVVEAITKEGNCWTVYGQVVNDIKEELRTWQGWAFQHVSRRANGVAHQLAQLAFMHGVGREWRAEFPLCVDECTPATF